MRLITESLSVTQPLSYSSSPSSSHRMSSSDTSKALLMQHFLKNLTIMLSEMAFHAADTNRATSEGAARKGLLKEWCGLEPRTNFFFRLRNRQKLVRIRFENIRYTGSSELMSQHLFLSEWVLVQISAIVPSILLVCSLQACGNCTHIFFFFNSWVSVSKAGVIQRRIRWGYNHVWGVDINSVGGCRGFSQGNFPVFTCVLNTNSFNIIPSGQALQICLFHGIVARPK